MKTKTFISNCGKFQFTIKITFQPSTEDNNVYDLMSKYHMNDYLHNDSGPAIIHLGNGHQEYWLNGKQLTKEESSIMCHNCAFANDLNDILNDKN